MMRGILAASLLGVTLAGCAAAREPSTAAPPPRAERPVYAVGDRWIRSDGVYDLIRIEDDRYVFSAGPDREVQLTRELGLAKVVRVTSAWSSRRRLNRPGRSRSGRWSGLPVP